MDAGCGDQRDDDEQDDQGDEHGALLVWVDNTKDNHVTVTMTTCFIVVIGAVTEQLAAMSLRPCEQRELVCRRPRDSYRIRESESEVGWLLGTGWGGVLTI